MSFISVQKSGCPLAPVAAMMLSGYVGAGVLVMLALSDKDNLGSFFSDRTVAFE